MCCLIILVRLLHKFHGLMHRRYTFLKLYLRTGVADHDRFYPVPTPGSGTMFFVLKKRCWKYIYFSSKYEIQNKVPSLSRRVQTVRECLVPIGFARNIKISLFFRFCDPFSTPRSGPTDPPESGPKQIRIHLKVLNSTITLYLMSKFFSLMATYLVGIYEKHLHSYITLDCKWRFDIFMSTFVYFR